MFGKPIALAKREDVDRLITDAIPEGRHIEFKEAVPVSKEEIKRQGALRSGKAFDESVASGKGIAEHGRNELLEELIAFANGDGGIIVLGMSETEEKPPRAAKIHPVPHVFALERRLRDAIVSCIEPRLPYAAVQAIETNVDGSGVILLEAQSSTLGPHRVRQTRVVPIRREDSCSPLSMPEIHDMVLSNARRFDETLARLASAEKQFELGFIEFCMEKIPKNVIGEGEDRLYVWIRQLQKSICAVRATIVPHQSIGLSRLESFQDLTATSIVRVIADPLDSFSLRLMKTHALNARPILNGASSRLESQNDLTTFLAERDGLIEITKTRISDTSRYEFFEVATTVATALCMYENLRRHSSSPSMPAEICVAIHTLGRVVPEVVSEFDPLVAEYPFDNSVKLPRFTVSDLTSFDQTLTSIIFDIGNAVGIGSEFMPRFFIDWASKP